MSREVVPVFRLREFTKTEPLEAQSQNSTFREIDTKLLFVFNCLPFEEGVTVHTQNGRDLTRKACRLIENRSGPKAGDNLIAYLAQSIPSGGDDYSPMFALWRCIHPFLRLSV